MTKSISCHRGIQDDLCSTFVPIATEVPHVLSAVAALAAAHRRSSGVDRQSHQFEVMRGRSLQQLGSALSLGETESNEAILATTLILCLAEIAAPTQSTTSWRAHLRGASAWIQQSRRTRRHSNLSTTSVLLLRKYQALQAIALACGPGRYESYVSVSEISPAGPAFIDDLAGFSSRLLPVFEEINRLDTSSSNENRDFVCDQPPSPPHFNCDSLASHQAHLLFDRVQTLLGEREESSGSVGNPSTPVNHDLLLLDEAYHHMAILQIYRRGCLSVPYQMIEHSKQVILRCLSHMTFQTSPCPGVAALPPLFVAGCLSTCPEDRQKTQTLLRSLWMNFGMGNVLSAKTLLERLWGRHDRGLPQSSDDVDLLPY
jgi:hypothetical protein